MRFDEKLKNHEREEVWQEYCGFLDLDMDSYMQIQNRLMLEQILLWGDCALGRRLADGDVPRSIDEFRESFPLTTYGDYADVLLLKQDDMLPDKPIIWIQTTWEGGRHPIKVAPYTEGMLQTYRNNVIACMILCSSTDKGKFNVRGGDTILYGLAPLPYATGLLPLALNEEIDIDFLPPVKEAQKLSFKERNVLGFKMGLTRGIDYFFGLGSVAYYVSMSVASLGKSGKKNPAQKRKISPALLLKLARAKSRCKKEGRDLMPKDLFKLKGFMCAGTDNNCYKDDLEELWGVRPLELFAGTEPSCIGTETWNRDGMYFFPDTCFYEFIPEDEMLRSFDDPDYTPQTYLMDQVLPGEKYELVISVLKGGAFMRYRVGDVYRCVGLASNSDRTRIPRFQYIDRVPNIIDIAGFTRISEQSIESVLKLSGLQIKDWLAAKEYNEQNRPLLHMYVELEPHALASQAVSREILREHLSIYFKYVDHDYEDLKKILGMDPLAISIVRCGSFAEYGRRTGRSLKRINPSPHEIRTLVALQQEVYMEETEVDDDE